MIPSRILITDSVAINTGDAAILKGVVSLLRTAFPSAEIRIHCHHYNEVHKRYPGLPIRRSLAESSRLFAPRYFWRWPAVVRYRIAAGVGPRGSTVLRPAVVSSNERSSVDDYRWADTIVSSGGSFLTDSYHFDHVLAGYELGIALGKTMVILGQTLGPFADSRNLETVGRTISRFDLVAVRDERSGKIAKEMGVAPENLTIAADMAFNLTYKGERRSLATQTAPRVGVSVRRWIFPGAADAMQENERYIGRMVEAIDMLVDQTAADIVFMSTCQGESGYAYRDDEVASEIRERMRHKDHAIIDRSFNTPENFMEKAAGLDIVLGTRMHACILAMLAGVPSVNVEYEFKSRELYNRLALEDLIVDILDFKAEELAAKTVAVLTDQDSARRRVVAGVDALRQENAAVAEYMRRRFS